MAVPFATANVLEDPELRDRIKQFTSWPTIPKLHVKGEIVGGCDIITEMSQSGELARVLAKTGIKTADPARAGTRSGALIRPSGPAARPGE